MRRRREQQRSESGVEMTGRGESKRKKEGRVKRTEGHASHEAEV